MYGRNTSVKLEQGQQKCTEGTNEKQVEEYFATNYINCQQFIKCTEYINVLEWLSPGAEWHTTLPRVFQVGRWAAACRWFGCRGAAALSPVAQCLCKGWDIVVLWVLVQGTRPYQRWRYLYLVLTLFWISPKRIRGSTLYNL